MARTARFTEDELQKALKLRDDALTAAEFRKAMSIILSAKLGLDAVRVAELLGTSRSTIFRNRSKIRNKYDITEKSWGGRRRYSLSLEEEREFLASFEAEASTGGVLSVPPIHAALIKRLGHATSPSTTYRMLARHKWRKVQPDTKHPKSDHAAQEEFKKNSRSLWKPPA
jgi:transposase